MPAEHYGERFEEFITGIFRVENQPILKGDHSLRPMLVEKNRLEPLESYLESEEVEAMPQDQDVKGRHIPKHELSKFKL